MLGSLRCLGYRPQLVSLSPHNKHSAAAVLLRGGWREAGAGALPPSRGVNTDTTPLAAAFNSKPHPMQGLSMLLKNPTGLFGRSDLRSSDGFYLMKDRVVIEAADLIEECCSPDRKRKMVEVVDELSNCVCTVADLAAFVRMTHPDPAYQYAALEATIIVGSLVEKLNVNFSLYEAVRDVVRVGDLLPTTPMDDHVNRLFIHDFEQCGINLDEETRYIVGKLNGGLLSLCQEFMSCCLQPLPDSTYSNDTTAKTVVDWARNKSSDDESYRQQVFTHSHQPQQRHETLLKELVFARHRMARLCGYESFAHRCLENSLAGTPEVVDSFLKQLSHGIRPLAEQDIATMQEMKSKEMKQSKPVAEWDMQYYRTKARQEVLQEAGVTHRDLCSYFSLGSVMDGLNSLLQQLYGVSLDLCSTEPGECWADNVYKLAVSDQKHGLLGHIYCDFIHRKDKPQQACHHTIVGGKLMPDGSYQNPVVVVQMNVVASWTGAPLLSPDCVETLFHEMGHAMHSMLGRTQYQHVCGTRCCTDFAEVPSILMEFFVNDPRVLGSFARHHGTGAVMPAPCMEAMIRSKGVMVASEWQTQVLYSAVDQRFHSSAPLGEAGRDGNSMTVVREEHDKHYSLPYIHNIAWQHRFSHFVGYGGKYYSYLVSRAVASWIWHTYFIQDPFSRSAGQRYRDEVLSLGGSVSARQMLESYLDREVTPEGLVQSLMQELQGKEGPRREEGGQA